MSSKLFKQNQQAYVHEAFEDESSTTWDIMYAVAEKYYRSTGSLEASPKLVTEDGYALGAWLQYLRTQYKKNKKFLTDEQFRMLNAIGMRWDNKYDLQWESSYEELCAYHRENGHINIPAAYTTDSGLNLGRWIRRQIESYKKGHLRQDRIERLEKLGIVWNPDGFWEERFRLAKAYSEENHGIHSMPDDYTVNGIRLKKWLKEQKSIGDGRRKKKLTPEQREKLEFIGLVFGKP